MKNLKVVIVSGLSGSGKTTAIKALEDIGFFCIDNLPVMLLDKFLLLCDQQAEVTKVAVGIDIRERKYFGEFIDALRHLREDDGFKFEIIFLDSSTETLIRRFSETRRRHPLDDREGIAAAIEKEKEMMTPLKEISTSLIDTSELNVHQLKQMIQNIFGASEEKRISVTVISFGYRNGIPPEADYVFDCRFLPNPYFVEAMRLKTGLEDDVNGFVTSSAEFQEWFAHVSGFLKFVLPNHEGEGRPAIAIAFGCTGGRHRSVACAAAAENFLKGLGFRVHCIHRDIEEKGI